MKHKRNDPMCDPWDSQGDEKNAISISFAFCLDFLISMLYSTVWIENHQCNVLHILANFLRQPV